MKIKNFVVIFLSSFVIVSCGGGTGTNQSEEVSFSFSKSLTPVISITFSSSNLSPYQNDSFVLTWSSNAKSCTASGNWSGTLPVTGNKTIENSTVGTTTYTITCVDGTLSANSTVTVTTLEKPYFLEVTSAFPDPTKLYWFFDTTKPDQPIQHQIHAATVTAVESVDLDSNGTKEFVMVFSKGKGKDELRGQYVSEPCRTTTAVYEYVNSRFVDASDKFLTKDRNFGACIGDTYSSVVDANNDGRPDIFYSANQEDGRNPDLGSDMTSPLVGWISQPDGKYQITRFGPNKWYHSIGSGIDEDGKVFLAGQGFPSEQFRNSRFVHDQGTFRNLQNQQFPDVSSVTFAFLKRSSSFSNLLIQQTWQAQMGAVGFYKENGIWFQTNTVAPVTKFLAEETVKLWSNDTRKVSILDFNGKMILGTGGGSNISHVCEFRMDKNQPSIVVGVIGVAEILNYKTGAVIEEATQIVGRNIFMSYDIKDKKLNMLPIQITGESNFGNGKMQCLDVNNDGYDDLILGLGNDDNIRHQRIYINQKDKSFQKLSLTDRDYMQLGTKVDMYGSHMADFDNDGKMDVVVFPSNHTDNSSLNGEIKFYKGVKTIL